MILTTWKMAGVIGLCLMILSKPVSSKVRDPGPRSGANAGGPIPGLTTDQLNLFNEGARRFAEIDNVTDGLGPRMNLNSCSGCHAHPAIGGSGPTVNQQYQFATSPNHGNNTVPFFMTPRGPTREARFKKTDKGTPDGGVHDIFTIAGMNGVPDSCKITQPDFSDKKNIIFRIPTPLFGGGLIEQIRDSDILANIQTQTTAKNHMQIKGNPTSSFRGILARNKNGSWGKLTIMAMTEPSPASDGRLRINRY